MCGATFHYFQLEICCHEENIHTPQEKPLARPERARGVTGY